MRLPCLLALLCLACGRGDSVAHAPSPPAVDSVLALWQQSPLVGVGEMHRSRAVHQFLQQLISDPRFPATVNDIVVEFGNAYYQPIMDRYIAGDSVPMAEVQEAWRGTGQWLVWDSPLYAGFFAKVRELNRALPADQRMRVLLGDPPIHWAEVRSADDYRRFAQRDSAFAGVVEREVLQKGRRALLIIGATHLEKRPAIGGVPRSGMAAELLESNRKGALASVWTVADPGRAAALGLDGTVRFRRVSASDPDTLAFGRLLPAGIVVQRISGRDTAWVPIGNIGWPPIATVIDALLYVGPDTTSVQPDPRIYNDSSYQAELRRRAVILQEVYGVEFLPGLEAELERWGGR